MQEDGPKNTPVAEYCRRFAERGYVCFSIDYRLIPEDPDPGTIPVLVNPDNVPRSRLDVVRRQMNLPPATSEMVANGIEAAAVDFTAAIGWVRANAVRLAVDASRIAVGGFSAGGRSAMHAVFARQAEAAAVVLAAAAVAAAAGSIGRPRRRGGRLGEAGAWLGRCGPPRG